MAALFGVTESSVMTVSGQRMISVYIYIYIYLCCL